MIKTIPIRERFERVQNKHKELRRVVVDFGREVQEVDQYYRTHKADYPRVLGTYFQGYLRLVRMLIHLYDRSQSLAPPVLSVLESMDKQSRDERRRKVREENSTEKQDDAYPLASLGFSLDEDELLCQQKQ